MTAEQTILLELAGCTVQGKQPNKLPDSAKWQELVWEANQQGVILTAFYALSRMPGGIPEQVNEEFSRLARRATARNLQVEFSQAELVSQLEQKGYPYLILKGEASASYYPLPELRQLGDVDFMVPQAYVEPVLRDMTELGYTDKWNDHHWLLQKGRNRLEMHLEPTGIPEKNGRQEITEFFRDLYQLSKEATGSSGNFRVAGDVHHGMILLLHMVHHTLGEGIGLRHMMDWACFVNATAGQAFWQERLLPLLRQIGLFRFAAVMTKTCAMYFAIVCPQWATEVEESLCRQMMEDILTGGNFGRKSQEHARAGNMLPKWEKNDKRNGKLRLLYVTLRETVLHKHPQWEKKPIRLFFSMLGKAIRYIVLFFRGKRPNLLKVAACADARRSVYEQLRLFETENSL